MFDYNDFARSGTAPTANGSSKPPALNRSRPKTRGGSSDLADLNMSLKMDKRNHPENIADEEDIDSANIAIEAWETAKKKDKPSSRLSGRKPSAGATYKNDAIASAYTSQFRPVKTTAVSSPRSSNKGTNANARVAEIRAIYGMSDRPSASASSSRNTVSASRKKPRAPAANERPRSSAPDVPKTQRKSSSRKIITKEEEPSSVAIDVPPPPAEQPHFFEASPEIERPESRKLYLGQPTGSPKATKPALKAPRSAGPVSSQQTSLKDHVDAESSGMVRMSSFAGFVRPASLWQDDIDIERPPSRQKSAFPTHLADIERTKAFDEAPKDEAASIKVPTEQLPQRPPSRQRIAAQNLFDSAEPPPTAPSTAKPKLSINTSEEMLLSVTPMISPVASCSSAVTASPAPTFSHAPFMSSDSDAQLLAQVESMTLLPSNDVALPVAAPRPARAWLNSSSGSRKEPASQPTSTRAQPASSSATPNNRDRMFQAALAPRYDPYADGFADLDVQTPSTFKIEPRSHTAKVSKGRKSPTDVPTRPKSMAASSHPPQHEAPLVSQTASSTRRRTEEDVGDAWGIERRRTVNDGDRKNDRGDEMPRKINSDEQSSENVSYLSCSPNISPDEVYDDDDDLTVQSCVSDDRDMHDMNAASLQSFMLESSLGEDFLSLFAQHT